MDGSRASGTICNRTVASFENWNVGEFREATAIADNHQIDPSPGVELWLALGAIQDRHDAFDAISSGLED